MMTASAAQPSGWRLSELLSGLANEMVDDNRPIERISLSSANAGPGALFLSADCGRAQALADVQLAAEQGCAAIAVDADGGWCADETSRLSKSLSVPVISISALSNRAGEIAARFYGDPSASLEVIGVAGFSSGSLGYMLAQALADERCGLISAEGVGFPAEHFDRDLPAADAVSLQHSLAALKAAGAHRIALDTGSQSLEQTVLNSVQVRTAVFDGMPAAFRTAVSPGADANGADSAARSEPTQPSAIQDHCRVLPSASTERPLLEQSTLRWVLLNRDNAASRPLERRLAPGIARGAYSLKPNASFRGHDVWARTQRIVPTANSLRLDLETSGGAGTIELPILGASGASDLLAILCVLLSQGRDLQSSLKALGRIRPAPGRLEWFGGDRAPLVVVDTAQTPATLHHSIDQLRAHRPGRLVSVFGCPGGRNFSQRPRMGTVAEQLSDQVILTDDNPAGEDGDRIIEQILSGFQEPRKIIVERQRALAIRRAIALAGDGDTVLISGKGHATTQDMGELRLRFSDRAQVVQALNEWRGLYR